MAAYVSNVAAADVEAAVRDAIRSSLPRIPVHTVAAVAQRCGVVNGYADPGRLGPDRWLAMIGAHRLCPGRPVLVCSFGTATTIDLLEPSTDGAARTSEIGHTFVGGLILPGYTTMRDALGSRTARLPTAVGRVVEFAIRTEDAIESGIVTAQVGAVGQAVRAAHRRLGTRPERLYAGGAAAALAPSLAAAGLEGRLADDLVLQGLAAVAYDDAVLALSPVAGPFPAEFG